MGVLTSSVHGYLSCKVPSGEGRSLPDFVLISAGQVVDRNVVLLVDVLARIGDVL